jgi:hypothetical protein
VAITDKQPFIPHAHGIWFSLLRFRILIPEGKGIPIKNEGTESIIKARITFNNCERCIVDVSIFVKKKAYKSKSEATAIVPAPDAFMGFLSLPEYRLPAPLAIIIVLITAEIAYTG